MSVKRCHHYSSFGLDYLSFSRVSYMRMVKWKLGISLCTLLLILTYLTSQLRNQIQYLTIYQKENLLLFPTLVFIHIQKTAGSQFERSIVRRLYFDQTNSCLCPISKRRNLKLRCNCLRNTQPWLISRFSVGWLCGVHADWMTYHRCLPSKMNFEYGLNQRKFFYATLLREPITRFISEYLHNLRGATWLSERLSCQKAQQYRNQSSCWTKRNLTDYISCPFNSAINRQTRMLSSPTFNCSSSSFMYSNLIDLRTAKENLQSMEFFGLTEYLHLSQLLFEQTKFCQLFSSCSFQSYLEQDLRNNQTDNYIQQNLTQKDFDYLRQINSDDIQLYEFAKKLFFQRTCHVLGIACQ